MGPFANFDLPRDVVMISTADWDAPLWTNKQQIASRLVSDFRVLYVEPLASLADGRRGYTHRYWRDPSGVHVLRPPGTVPFGQKIPQVNEINHRLVAPVIKERLEQLGFKDYILWLYPPTAAPYLQHLEPALSCYDCVDEYSAMPGAWLQVTRQMERRMLEHVDAVFTTARSLYEDKVLHNKNTHHVPNVADFEHFHRASSASPAPELEGLRRPVIGFVGALNYKLDDHLLERLFEARTEWNFVFVGPDRGFGIEHFIHYHNVHFVGKKNIDELPAYLAGMDVCIIPYKIDRYTRGVLPMKLFEYLSTGKPVVATRLPELEDYAHVVELAGDAQAYVEAIERCLHGDHEDDRRRRVEIARENSWEKRISTILGHLETSWRNKAKHR